MVFCATMVNFWMKLHINKWSNFVMDDGWVHMLAETLLSFVRNLRWNIVMDDWNLDEEWYGKGAWGAHFTILCVNTCIKKTSAFVKLNHQNGSNFYNFFSWVDIHGIYYTVKNGNQIWGSVFWIKHTVSN